MITLRPMTEPEFARFRRESIEDYALERARNFGTAPDDERAAAARQYAELLKAGRQTPGHRFWAIVPPTQEVAGSLWVFVEEERHRAFIFYIIVGEAYRGRGYAKEALAALEDDLKPLGITHIALNVFQDNAVARHVYQRLGYQTTNMTMQKTIQ